MGSLLSTHEGFDDGIGQNYYYNNDSNTRPRRKHRTPRISDIDYSEAVELTMTKDVYLSGPDRKANSRSNRSNPAKMVTFLVWQLDPNSSDYVLAERKMAGWTQFKFVEFKDKMGTDPNGKPRYPARLQLASNLREEFLVPWSSFIQNFTPFSKEESAMPENPDTAYANDWAAYIFEDSVWNLNQSHIIPQESAKPNSDQRTRY